MSRSTLPVLALSAAALVALSACSPFGGGSSGQSSSQPNSSASAPPASSSAPATPAPSGTGTESPAASPSESGAPSDPNQLGNPVATRTFSTEGDTITMKLYPVSRTGTVSHLNLTLSSDGDRVAVDNLLDDASLETGDTKTSNSADGITLIDNKNSKLYLVASDELGQCLCSRNLGTVYLSDSQPVLVTATFAAPPTGLTQVDVQLPSFGTVKSVPVQ